MTNQTFEPDELEAFEKAGLADGLAKQEEEATPLVRIEVGKPRQFLGLDHWVAYYYKEGNWNMYVDSEGYLKIFLTQQHANSFIAHYTQWWQAQVQPHGNSTVPLHDQEPVFRMPHLS
jgi:hypothetical protein